MPSPTLSPAALELVRRGAVFDAHVDSLMRTVDLGHDLADRGPGHLDLVRGREGGLGSVVLVSWVDPERFAEHPARRADTMIDAAQELARRRPDLLRLVGNGDELAAARRAGAVAGILGIEGGHPIEGSLERLRAFFERGLRVLTLVWNNHLPWVRSCQDGAGADVPPGLSAFGHDVVRSMNEWGILVDLSHAGERSFYDALETTERAPIASHSGCRALHDHPRNLDDDQLRALAQAGGVMGIVFHPGFLDADARAEEMRVRATDAYAGLDRSDPGRLFFEQQRVMRAAATPMPLERLVDHVVHAVEVAGIEHVGLGSDFDGVERVPEELEDASRYGALAERLLQRGFAPEEVRGILGGNMERVFAQATGAGTEAAATRSFRALRS